MKKIIVIISLLISGIIIYSCSKEDNNVILKEQKSLISNNKSNLPPVNWFECGPPDPSSPYPCPNASCPYMGWDCAVEVLIKGIKDKVAYQKASELLDGFINHNNTGEFFKDYPEQVAVLMPELCVAERRIMLDDLKNQVTSVRKHPVYSQEFDEIINIYQIYVKETGERPNYGNF